LVAEVIDFVGALGEMRRKLFDRHFDVVGNYETCTKNDSSADGGRQQSSADENNESPQVKFNEIANDG
jgi:hypothetical protein